MFLTTYIIDLKNGHTDWIPDFYSRCNELQLAEVLVITDRHQTLIITVSIAEQAIPDQISGLISEILPGKKITITDTLDAAHTLANFIDLMCGRQNHGSEIGEIFSWIKENFNYAMTHNGSGPVLGKLYRLGLEFAQKVYNRPEFKSISTTAGEAILDITRKISEKADSFQILLCMHDQGKLTGLAQELKKHGHNKIYIFSDKFSSSYESALDSGCIPVDYNQLENLLKSNTVIVNLDMANESLWGLMARPVSENRNSLYIYFQFDNSALPQNIQKLPNLFSQDIDHINGVIGLHRKKRKELLASLDTEIRNEIESFYQWMNSDQRYQFSGIVSRDREMQNIFELIHRVAPVDISVLVNGDTGTGKELIARAIHDNSNRRQQKFVAVNCSAIPETLLEAELFGYEKGAFTGAVNMKKGLVEVASGGTLFFDEIGDIPPLIQVKLLRVLQEREIMRLGKPQPIKVDVRVIAATNRQLSGLIEEGKFRTDLYYRVNTVQINLPSLADRRDDILLLTRYFIEKMNRQHNKSIHSMTDDVKLKLQQYDWPGNIRELENVIERAVAVSVGDRITLTDLPDALQHQQPAKTMSEEFPVRLKEIEAKHITELLEQQKNNYGQVAESLGISRTTLWRKMKEYGISR